MKLVKKKNRVAVIPVDPSSHISGGSILGNIEYLLQKIYLFVLLLMILLILLDISFYLECIEILLCSSFLLFSYCDDDDLFSVRTHDGMRDKTFSLSNVQFFYFLSTAIS